jgi:hypothetical protein
MVGISLINSLLEYLNAENELLIPPEQALDPGGSASFFAPKSKVQLFRLPAIDQESGPWNGPSPPASFGNHRMN